MIEWISDWAGGIIIAVIIATVIEMILPEGNCKKYIKIVIGVYVLFTIISPVITKFTGKSIEVSDILDLNKYIEEAEESVKIQNSIQSDNQSSIMEMYSSGIKDDMVSKIEAKGYIVNNIEIGIADDESYNLTYITVEVRLNEKSEENEEINEVNKVDSIDRVVKVEVSISNTVSEIENSKSTQNGENERSLSNSEKKELKEYLSSVYDVQEENITIN